MSREPKGFGETPCCDPLIFFLGGVHYSALCKDMGPAETLSCAVLVFSKLADSACLNVEAVRQSLS